MQHFDFQPYVKILMVNLPSYYDYTVDNEALCRNYNIANIYTREQIMIIINDMEPMDQYYGVQYYRRYNHKCGDELIYSVIAQQDIKLPHNRKLAALMSYQDMYSEAQKIADFKIKAESIINKINILSFLHAFNLWRTDNLQKFYDATHINISISPSLQKIQ